MNAFLAPRREVDPTRFPDLSLSVVKLLGKGEYALKHPGRDVPGHFGLAVSEYTHSTASNRRFPDLITHRLLKAALSGAKLPYTVEELDALGRHCTGQEVNVGTYCGPGGGRPGGTRIRGAGCGRSGSRRASAHGRGPRFH